MKKILVVLLSLSLFIQLIKADGGTSCAASATAIKGTNHSNHTISNSQWFSYTATLNGKLIITNCGQTNKFTDLAIYTNCSSSALYYGNECGSDQKYIAFDVTLGTTYYINWTCDDQVQYDWVLEEHSPITGEDCATAITVNNDTMTTSHTSYTDKWYSYTATSDGLLNISSCGNTSNETAFEIYYDCSSTYDYVKSDQCGNTAPYQSKKLIEVLSGSNYLIKWKSCGQSNTYYWTIKQSALPKGASCEDPLNAMEGVNTTNHYGNTLDQWYNYTATDNGYVTLSSKEFNYTLYLNVYNNCINELNYTESNGGLKFYALKGETYNLQISYDNQDFHQWRLSFDKQSPPPGISCSNAITAKIGINSASNIAGNQWFSYTPTQDGILTISTCGLTTEDTYAELYLDCLGSDIESSDDDCSYQSSIEHNVNAGTTYFINWRNEYTSSTYNWNLSLRNLYTGTEIKSFYFNNKTISSTIDSINRTVNVVIGSTESLTNLTPIFELSTNANAYIGAVSQNSGSTSNNYTSSLIYTIKAEDNITTSNWTINVTKAASVNSAKDILSYKFNFNVDSIKIDHNSHTINFYPFYNQIITNLIATFSLSTYASAKIGSTVQTSGSTGNNFNTSKTYTITAQDGSTQDWVVQAVINPKPHGESCSDPKIVGLGNNITSSGFYTQFLKYKATQTGTIVITSSFSEYISIYSYNCSGSYIESGYTDYMKFVVTKDSTYIFKIYNARNIDLKLELTGIQTGNKIIDFYANNNECSIDTINHAITGSIEPLDDIADVYTYFDLSLGAVACIGNDTIQKYDYLDYTNPVNFVVKSQNKASQNWLVTVTNRPLNPANDFNSFMFTEQSGNAIIDYTNHTVKIGVLSGTDRSKLIPSFMLSKNASCKIATVVQTSGKSMVDFTSPVTYSITSESGVSQNWTVTVSVGTVLSNLTEIITFRFNDEPISTSINSGARTINILMKKGTLPNALVATFYLSPGATAKINSTIQVSGTTANDFRSSKIYTITAEDGTTTSNWTVNVTVSNASSETSISAFSIPGQVGNSVIDASKKLINVTLPYGSILTNKTATFAISAGASAKIGSVVQVSGVTLNDYSKVVYFRIDAEDGVNYSYWSVIVNVEKNSETIFKTFSLPGQTSSSINSTLKTITVEMPYGSNVSNLAASFTISDGAIISIAEIAQVSGVTKNNYSNLVTYKITAENVSYTQNWVVTVNIPKGNEVEIVSFNLPGQIENSIINSADGTIAVKFLLGSSISNLVANFTLSNGATVKIGTTTQVSGTTINNFSAPLVYAVTGLDGTTKKNWTVTATFTSARTETAITSYSLPNQIGDAQITSGAISVIMPRGTILSNIVATYTLSGGASVKVGNTTQTSGSTANNFNAPITYIVTAEDGTTTKNWVVSASTLKNNETAIKTYSIPNQLGNTIINSANRTIEVTMPYGTIISNLVASYTVSDGAAIKIGSAAQVSGTTANNFSLPVVYSIIAEDGTTVNDWTITVKVAKNTQTAITAFSLSGQIGTSSINATNSSIGVDMPYGSDVSNLVSTFVLSNGASAKIGSINQISGVTKNNFKTSVTYVITAEDGITSKNWTIIVTIAKNAACAISSFSIPKQIGDTKIDTVKHTISVIVPANTDLTALVATFQMSAGAVVKVGDIIQVSGSTTNNFSANIMYKVTAENGNNTQNWTVSVNKSTSIESITASIRSEIYPNPSNGLFNVTLKASILSNINLEVFNSMGVRILNREVKVLGHTLENIDLSGYCKGVYLLKLNSKTYNRQFKLIVK